MKKKLLEMNLSIAGINIKLQFEHSKNKCDQGLYYYQTFLIKNIKKELEGFITKSKKAVANIYFSNSYCNEFLETLKKDVSQKQKYLHLYTNKKNKYFTNSTISLFQLCHILKYIVEKHLVNNGVLMHASAVVDKHNRAYIFLGESGSGKSTISNFLHTSPHFKKIADDSIYVVNKRSNYFVYQTILREKDDKETKSNSAYKLHEINFLEKTKNSIKKQKVKKDNNYIPLLIKQIFMYKKIEKSQIKLLFLLVKKFNNVYRTSFCLDRKKITSFFLPS
jgi:hypothetical protein